MKTASGEPAVDASSDGSDARSSNSNVSSSPLPPVNEALADSGSPNSNTRNTLDESLFHSHATHAIYVSSVHDDNNLRTMSMFRPCPLYSHTHTTRRCLVSRDVSPRSDVHTVQWVGGA